MVNSDWKLWELISKFIKDMEKTAISIPYAWFCEHLVDDLLSSGLALGGADEKGEVLVVSFVDGHVKGELIALLAEFRIVPDHFDELLHIWIHTFQWILHSFFANPFEEFEKVQIVMFESFNFYLEVSEAIESFQYDERTLTGEFFSN